MNQNPRPISRRHVLGGTAALTTGWVLSSTRPLRAADRPLKVAAWGGFFQDVLDEVLYPAFTRETGIEVESIGKPIGDAWLVQLDQASRAGRVIADVSALVDIPMARGYNSDLWAPLDLAKIPNAANLPPYAINRSADGMIGGVAWTFYYIILVSNVDVYETAPTSWKDLWDPENTDRLGLMAQPDIGYLLDVTAKVWFGSQDILDTKDGILQVLGKISELQENVKLWYRDEAQFQQGLQTGEIPMGQYYNDVATVAIAEGLPIRRTFPEEGALLNSAFWAVSADSELQDEAATFIDYTLRPDVQASLVRSLGLSASIPRELTDITDEEWAMVSTDVPSIIPRYDIYVKWGDWINDRWTETIVGL